MEQGAGRAGGPRSSAATASGCVVSVRPFQFASSLAAAVSTSTSRWIISDRPE